MIAILVAAQLSVTPVPCPTVQPGSDWVCQDGGWKHPNDPTIRRTPEPPPPPPPPAVTSFVIGRTYWRDTGGAAGPTTLYISAMGLHGGNIPVFFAECVTVGDNCFFPGYIRPIWIGTDAKDWTDVTPR